MLTALGALLRLPVLPGESFWLDEHFTVTALDGSLRKTFDAVRRTEGSPPLYYVLAWVWTSVAGTSEVAVRSLSWLLGVATIPLVHLAAGTLAGPRAGLAAALLATVNPMLVWYSAEARSYALVVFLAAAGFVAFARALTGQGGRGSVAVWAATSALAVWAHYFAGFLFAAEAAVLLVGTRLRRETALACAAVPAAAAPLAGLASEQAERTEWIRMLDGTARTIEIVRALLVGVSTPDLHLAKIAVIAAGAAAIAGFLSAPPSARRRAAVAALVAAAAIAAPLVLALGGLDFVLARNLIVVIVPAVIALGIVVGASRSAVAATALLALVVVSLTAIAGVALDERLQKPNWRSASRGLDVPSEARLVIAWGDLALPLSRYLPRAQGIPLDQSIPLGEAVVFGFDGPGYDRHCWWGSACSVPRVLPPERPPVPGFRLLERRETSLFTVLRYAASPPVTASPAALLAAYPGAPSPYVLVQLPG